MPIIWLLVGYAILDRLTRRIAALAPADYEESFLLAKAILAEPLGVVVLGASLVALAMRSPQRFLSPWSAVEHGSVLRWFVTPLMLLIVWRHSGAAYNYFADEWHTADRLLLLAIAGLSLARPVFLIGFVLQSRVMAGQYAAALGAVSGQNIDDLLLMALLIIAAMHLMFVITGREGTALVVLVLGMLVASHFFLPGVKKLTLGWFGGTDLENFPLSSYTAGWRGQGDGAWSRSMSSMAKTLAIPLMIGTLVLEVGAPIAAAEHRLLRLWLPLWMSFHVLIFAWSGYWLFEWVVLEAALLVLISRPGSRPWLDPNRTPARGVIAIGVVVVLGGPLFHPPGLAWFDAPVSYGYEVEAVGVSGMTYHVPLTAFAPFQADMSFVFAEFGPTRLPTGGYGSTSSEWLLHRLNEVQTFAQLDALEGELDPLPPERRSVSEGLVLSWLDAVNDDNDVPWSLISPISRYWNGRPPETFDRQESLVSVEVVLVRSIHTGSEPVFDRTTVLVTGVDTSGRAVVLERVGS